MDRCWARQVNEQLRKGNMHAGWYIYHLVVLRNSLIDTGMNEHERKENLVRSLMFSSCSRKEMLKQ